MHISVLEDDNDQRDFICQCLLPIGHTVSRVRRKLELDGRHGLRLRSVYQYGYRLEQSQ